MNELSLFHAGSEILPATCNAISLFSHSMRDGWRRAVTAVKRESTVFRTSSSKANCGVSAHAHQRPVRDRSKQATTPPKNFLDRWIDSNLFIVAKDFPTIARRHCHPNTWIDERRHETYRSISEQHAAPRSVLAPHLIRVPKGIIWRMNDDLGMVMGIRSTMNSDQASSTVVFR